MALNHQVLKLIPLNFPHSVQILKTTLKFQGRLKTCHMGGGELPGLKERYPSLANLSSKVFLREEL